jgi:hypothetical protein
VLLFISVIFSLLHDRAHVTLHDRAHDVTAILHDRAYLIRKLKSLSSRFFLCSHGSMIALIPLDVNPLVTKHRKR